jgi:RNA polymerase sigma factor (sigma-70 family)
MEKQFYLTINGKEITVTEEVYRAYKRPIRREKKRIQRNIRCKDGNNIRCNGDCNTCEYARFHEGANGSDLSLDELLSTGVDIEDERDILDEIAERQKAALIRKAIMQLDESEQKIALMLGAGYKQKEIAESLGLKPYSVNRIIQRMQKKLKELL